MMSFMLPEKNKILLGAYYYLWWGRPTYPVFGGGIWRTSGSTNQPLLGRYNSREKSVIDKHIEWAKSAGIDFFAVNWNDIESWDDITLKDYYLKNPEASELKFCIFYDSIPALNIYRLNKLPSYDLDSEYKPGKTKGEKLLEDFDYLAENYFSRSNYLKINNRPAVIIYNASGFRNLEKYFDRLKINMEKKGISLFLMADVVCWAGVKVSKNIFSFLWNTPPSETLKVVFRAIRRLSPKTYEKDICLGKYFEAITGYNLFAENRTEDFLKNVNSLYQKFFQYAKSNNLYFIPNIMPGYDDRKLNGFSRPTLERDEGKFYGRFWQTAKKYLDPKLKMVLITSFNEWHEGTEIEPSKEYGLKYLKQTLKEGL